mgnify:CR=1 FL=1
MFKNTIHRWLSVALLATSFVLLAGCNGNTTPTETSQPTENITFQLSWTHEYSSSPFYMAFENGHFAQQNLNVTITEGGFGESGFIEPITEVLSGESDFGTSSATSLIEARAEGKQVVGIATILQRNPLSLISLKESNIITPANLMGKTIAVSDGAARTRLMIFLSQEGISESDVTIVPRVTFGIEPLMNGDVDVLAGWIINEAVMVEEAGSEANVMLLSDYGLDDYDFVIFTSQETLDNRPEMVERFLRAFLAGAQDVLSDTSKTTDAILKYNDQLDKQGQLTRLEAMLPLINPPGTPLGVMSLSVWEQSQQVLLDQGIISEPIDLNTVFTNSILDKIYGSN